MQTKAIPTPPLLIYVRSLTGSVSGQIWHDTPNPHSDYWNNKRSGFDRIVGEPIGLTEYAANLPLDALRVMHPPAGA